MLDFRHSFAVPDDGLRNGQGDSAYDGDDGDKEWQNRRFKDSLENVGEDGRGEHGETLEYKWVGSGSAAEYSSEVKKYCP
jgi:hypothetical protein